MSQLEYAQEDVRALHDIAAPWNVRARLDRSGISSYPILTPGLGSVSLASFIQAFTTGKASDPRVPILKEIWHEVETNEYYKTLMKVKAYRDAREKFEKQLRQMSRGKGEYEEIDKRIDFTYITGDLINNRFVISSPVRLEPDKPTARIAIDHIDALLEVHSMKGIGPFFSDFELEIRLRKFRAKLASILDSPRAENTMSANNCFVYMLANWFITAFGRPMPTVISDLCLVIGYEPDKSTIERWVGKAKERSLGKSETA